MWGDIDTDGSEYKKTLPPRTPLGRLTALLHPLAGGEGLAAPSPRTPSPLLALRALPFLPHSKISSDVGYIPEGFGKNGKPNK